MPWHFQRALRAIELARPGLGLPEDAGQPMAVPLKDPRFYAAILIGLAEDQTDTKSISAT